MMPKNSAPRRVQTSTLRYVGPNQPLERDGFRYRMFAHEGLRTYQAAVMKRASR